MNVNRERREGHLGISLLHRIPSRHFPLLIIATSSQLQVKAPEAIRSDLRGATPDSLPPPPKEQCALHAIQQKT